MQQPPTSFIIMVGGRYASKSQPFSPLQLQFTETGTEQSRKLYSFWCSDSWIKPFLIWQCLTLKSLLHNCCLQGKHHQSKNQNLIPFSSHYKPRLVYFFTIFSKTIYVLWPLALCMACIKERLLIKSGLWWRAYGTYSRQSFTIQTTWNKINPFYEFVNCKTTPGIAHIGTPKKGEIDALFLFVVCTISWFGSLVIISRQGNKFSIAQLIRSRS